MGKEARKVVAINQATGERREFESASECAVFLHTMSAGVLQALNRNGACLGWRMYDSPEYLRKRIAELERQLAEVEEIER